MRSEVIKFEMQNSSWLFGPQPTKTFIAAALDFDVARVAPDLAYVRFRYAALAPFSKIATPLSELRQIIGVQNAGTVQNRTLRIGQAVMQPQPVENVKLPTAQAAGPVVVGPDRGYVRSRHRLERHFKVIAGKVIDAHDPFTAIPPGTRAEP